MKITRYKYLAVLLAVFAFSFQLSAFSQLTLTNTPVIASPVLDAFNFLSTPSSNWMFATYGIFTKSEGEGFGIGALYKVSDNFGAVLRLDRIGNDTYMPSGNFQVQAPVTIMGEFTATLFAFTGIAPVLNSKPGHDGVIGIAGVGVALRTPEFIKSKSRFIPDDVVYDYERWSSYSGGQHRLGLMWKFR